MSIRRFAAVVLAVASVTSLHRAAAATLGGSRPAGLGAARSVVTGCDDDGITIAYVNSFDAATGSYTTSAVNLASIAAGCAGQTYQLTLAGPAGPLVERTGTLVPPAQTVTLATPLPSGSVTGAAIVIRGGAG